MHTLYSLILGPMVYAAAAVFAVGMTWRIVRILKRPAFAPTLKIFPSKKPAWLFAVFDALAMPMVARHNKAMWLALIVFHAGLGLLVVGHLELMADFTTLQLVPHTIFIGKGLVGLSMLVCLAYFFMRRLVSPTKDISVPEDYLLLALIFLAVLSGAQLSWARAWFDYQTMGLADYRAYFASLLTLKPSIAGIETAGHSFVLVAHVFFANLVLMVLPFTKLAHFIFTFALNKIRRG